MSKELSPEQLFNIENTQIGYEPASNKERLLIDITFFITAITACYEAINNKVKRHQIETLLAAEDWHEHYKNKKTSRKVLSESQLIEHQHELQTAIALTYANYDVLFAPKGLFQRHQKRFDIYLLRDHIIIEADLKTITSKNPDTIANRVKSGSEQATRLVIDIQSDIHYKVLIDGLRSGCQKNQLIKEVILLYKNKCHRLPKSAINSKNIYNILK